MLDSSTTKYDITPVEFDPFAGPEIILTAPATESQAEIWTLCLIGGGEASCAFNDSSSFRLTGTLNTEAMLKALQAVSDRHEALRTVLSEDGKSIFVYGNPPVAIDHQDLSQKSKAEQQQFIETYTRHIASTPLSLVNGPLFKTALFKLSDNEHYLTLLTHHIICDGWSLGIIIEDISKIYSALAEDRLLVLPPAQPFSQYAIEQKELAGAPSYTETEAFWLDHFKGSSHLLDVPADHPRPATRTYKSQRLDFLLDPQLVNDLKKLGRTAGSSFVITLLTAFEVFLQQITGQEEIIVGLPAAGQAAGDKYALVGHCVNLLALRSYPKRDLSFTEYLKIRKSDAMDAFEHQQYTFGTLLKNLNIPRDASRLPLVPVVFNIDMGMDANVNFYGLEHQYINNPREYEAFEIFLNVTDVKGQFTLEWSFNSYLFDVVTINRMMEAFEYLLQQFVKAPDTPIGNIPQLNTAALLEQLKGWNDTRADYPKERPLHRIISETAGKFPDKTALKFNGASLTYQQLNTQANQFAALLIKKGVKTGDKIALSVDRSAEMVIALLAIMKAGAAYIPVDPAFPPNRINYMLTDSGAVILLTSLKYKGRYASGAKEIWLEDVWPALTTYPETDPQVEVSGNDLIYILYTSGSTGQPKGVQITHRSVVNLLYSMQKKPGLTPDDRLLAVSTISFDIAGLEIFLPLITGAQTVIADAHTARDGYALLKLINNEHITVMQATPYTWRMLLASGWQKERIKVICGGEPLPKDLAASILTRASSLWNGYGPTEATIYSSIKEVTVNDERITIGTPVNNTRIYILDSFLKPLAPGTAGELYIGGDGLAKGYLNLPGLTDEKFITDPFSENEDDQLYRTGDLATFTDTGDIIYLSRIDTQIKIRGYRIEASEIEYHLNQDDHIKQAVVISRPDKGGDDQLLAYIVLTNAADNHAGPAGHVAHWRGILKRSLPDYMVPDKFITIPQMPLTPNGKVDKKALAANEWLPVHHQNNYIAPNTELEVLIADIWKKHLGLEKVSVNDNFFELGGHSLIAIKVMANIEKEANRRLQLAAQLQDPLNADASQHLQQAYKSALIPIKPDGNNIPLYIVHSSGLNVSVFYALTTNMDTNQPVYGIEAKSVTSDNQPVGSIEAIAANCIQNIKTGNPDGPYILAGYEFGGVVAFEMAKQLRAINNEVKMLALLNTGAHNDHGFWSRKYYKKSTNVIRQAWFWLTLQKNKKSYFIDTEETEEINRNAQELYTLQPQDITIELFKAGSDELSKDDTEHMGWRRYALKGVNIHRIPGACNAIFEPPNAMPFAKKLQGILNKVNL